MRKKLIAVIVVLASAAFIFAQSESKLYVHQEYHEDGRYAAVDNQVLFIQDKETGTRCYAVMTGHGAVAISCVPRAR